MPWNEVMDKWKAGTLKSGGSGKPVTSQKQAVAIMYSEKKASKSKPEYRSVLGRKVIHHSPDKHPEQDDAQVNFDKMMQNVDQTGGSGSYSGARKDMMPAQQPSPKPVQTLQKGLDYLQRLRGGGK